MEITDLKIKEMVNEELLKSVIKEAVMEKFGFGNLFNPDRKYDRVKLFNDPKVRSGKEWAEKGGNFAVERNGKVYYVSRSVAVSLCAYCKDANGNWCVLANQRGPSTRGAGLWNVPSGFLDYGETAENAAKRETWEETGVKIPDGTHIRLLGTNTGRLSGSQNVSMAFTCVLDGVTDDYPLSADNCEPGEVSDIRWIPVMDPYGRPLKDYQKYRWNGSREKVFERAQTALLPYINGRYGYDDVVNRLKKELQNNPTAMYLLNKLLSMKKGGR
jgi:8-oxo-dGTP diphosphatase